MMRNPTVEIEPRRTGLSADQTDFLCGYKWNGFFICNKFANLAKPHIFLALLVLQGILQSTSETYFLNNALAGKFSIPYSSCRWLIYASEITLLIVSIPIIHWGSTRCRPGWLAGSMAFASFCGILLSSELLTGFISNSQYDVTFTGESTICKPWYRSMIGEKLKWSWIVFIVIPIFYFLLRLNGVLHWAFGYSYIDDNVPRNISPLFISVALALKHFGPFIGLYLSSIYSSTFVIGSFWLSLCFAILIVAIFLGMFPKILPGTGTFETNNSGLLSAMQRILSNRVIIFSGLTAIFLCTFVINARLIEEKYIESTFYVSSNSLFDTLFSLQYFFGVLKPTVAAIIILLSGIVLYRVKPQPLFLCIWSIVCIVTAAGAIFALVFLKCSATPIHREASRNNLMEFCNENCGCSEDLPFMPSCTPFFPFVFYSPCHAGCTSYYMKENTKVYTNCSCVSTGSVEVGHCSGGKCRTYWVLYNIIVLVIIGVLASGFVGNIFICIRSTLPRDKTLTLGIIFLICTFMAKYPLKLLYDLIADWSCLYYVDGRCKIYDSSTLATYINLFHICLLLFAAGSLSIVCFLVQDLAMYEDQSSPKNHLVPMTEMTDFRSQLNQALQTRRESTSNMEEQKLLSETTQTVHITNHENENSPTVQNEDLRMKSKISEYKKNTLQKPLIPLIPPSINTNRNNYVNNDMIVTNNSSQISSNNIHKPLVPPKPKALINELKSSFSDSSLTNSTTPSSPTHSAGTTIRNDGYLTTLL